MPVNRDMVEEVRRQAEQEGAKVFIKVDGGTYRVDPDMITVGRSAMSFYRPGGARNFNFQDVQEIGYQSSGS